MIFQVLTLFPEMIDNYINSSIMKRALQSEQIACNIINIRDFARDKHQTADDTPFGGGPGMVMKPEPLGHAIEAAKAATPTPLPLVYLSPQGETWNQQRALEFSKFDGLTLLCGRYEGIDERVIETYVDYEVSIGDYVLTGGELGALVMMDSIARLIPGVLGNDNSASQDSFSDMGLLDCPHYTRPEIWNGQKVPEILMSGHHANIKKWRRKMSLSRTRERRPDIFGTIEPDLSKADKKLLEELD